MLEFDTGIVGCELPIGGLRADLAQRPRDLFADPADGASDYGNFVLQPHDRSSSFVDNQAK